MAKFQITYSMGNVINKKITIEAENKTDAVIKFLNQNEGITDYKLVVGLVEE